MYKVGQGVRFADLELFSDLCDDVAIYRSGQLRFVGHFDMVVLLLTIISEVLRCTVKL